MAVYEGEFYRTKGGRDVYLIRVDTDADEVRVVYSRTHHNGTKSGANDLVKNLDSMVEVPPRIKLFAKRAISDLLNTVSKLDSGHAHRT